MFSKLTLQYLKGQSGQTGPGRFFACSRFQQNRFYFSCCFGRPYLPNYRRRFDDIQSAFRHHCGVCLLLGYVVRARDKTIKYYQARFGRLNNLAQKLSCESQEVNHSHFINTVQDYDLGIQVNGGTYFLVFPVMSAKQVLYPANLFNSLYRIQ